MSETGLPDYEKDVITILADITRDWDTGFSGAVTASTRVVGDLGFESLDVVMLVSAVEQKYRRRDLPFEELLMTDGHYVDDLTVSQIAGFLKRHSA